MRVHKVLVALLCLLLTVEAFKIVKYAPKTRTIKEGESLNLFCQADDWYRFCIFELNGKVCEYRFDDDTYLAKESDCGDFAGRVMFNGIAKYYECGITIANATLEEEGTWKCRISYYYGEKEDAKSVPLTIDIEPLPTTTTTTTSTTTKTTSGTTTTPRTTSTTTTTTTTAKEPEKTESFLSVNTTEPEDDFAGNNSQSIDDEATMGGYEFLNETSKDEESKKPNGSSSDSTAIIVTSICMAAIAVALIIASLNYRGIITIPWLKNKERHGVEYDVEKHSSIIKPNSRVSSLGPLNYPHDGNQEEEAKPLQDSWI